MSDHTPTESGDQGLTRRDLIRKGAVLGGALAWSIPTVQTFGMAPAFAAATSFAISYVAVVAKCGDDYFRAKWEIEDGNLILESSGNPSLPCESGKFQEWPPHTYLGQGTLTAIKSGANVDVVVGPGCKIIWTLNKCGSICIVEEGLEVDSVTFTPCPNTTE